MSTETRKRYRTVELHRYLCRLLYWFRDKNSDTALVAGRCTPFFRIMYKLTNKNKPRTLTSETHKPSFLLLKHMKRQLILAEGAYLLGASDRRVLNTSAVDLQKKIAHTQRVIAHRRCISVKNERRICELVRVTEQNTTMQGKGETKRRWAK